MEKFDNTNAAENPEQKLRIDSPEQIVNIMWKSFEFSQGNPDFQKQILSFLSSLLDIDKSLFVNAELENMFNEMLINKNKETDIQSHKLADVHAHPYIKEPALIEESSLFSEYLRALEGLPINIRFNGAESLTTATWAMDETYLSKVEGRENRLDVHEGNNTLKDRWFSFGVHYLLRDNSAKNKAFDVLIAEMKKTPPHEYNGYIKNRMRPVVEKYNETHPDTPVDIDSILKEAD